MKKHFFAPELKQPQRMALVLSVGLLLTFANCYWIIVAEAMWFAIHITVMSIFFNAVFCLFVLLLVNFLLKQISPKTVFSKAELLMIYMMMCMGSAIAGHGFMKVMPFFMGLMLGEFVVGSFLSVMGTVLGKPVYSFWVY